MSFTDYNSSKYYKSYNSYNTQISVFAYESDKKHMVSSTPFVYNYLPNDGEHCITTNPLFNTTQSIIYSPDSVVRCYPSASVIRNLNRKTHKNTIQIVRSPIF